MNLVTSEIDTCQGLQVGEFEDRLQSVGVVYSLITDAPLKLTPGKIRADVSR